MFSVAWTLFSIVQRQFTVVIYRNTYRGSAGLLVSSSGLLTTDAFLIHYFTGKIGLDIPSLQREQHTKRT